MIENQNKMASRIIIQIDFIVANQKAASAKYIGIVTENTKINYLHATELN